MTLSDAKKLFRKTFPVKAGGPLDKARSLGAIACFDAVAEQAFGNTTQITIDSITDATAAGKAMLRATDASAQLRLLDNLPISATPAHPAFTQAYGPGGAIAWLLSVVGNLVPGQPAAPTDGRVDDIGDTFSFLPTSAYPGFFQYKVAGLPGVTGAAVLDATNSYVQAGRVYVKVVGPVPIGGLAVYVAGSGSIPDGKPLFNKEPFTGTAPTGGTITPGTTIGTPGILVYPSTAY